MYNVLIVDDELLVINSLRNRISWNDLGFEVIGDARNGIAAYEKILQLRPDIVFTDIRMAGMNGLELIQKVNELSLNLQFIVISGYAEFAYAQNALKFGALDYCLKPFDENEIKGILKKAKAVLDKSKASYENQLLTLLEDDSAEGQVLKLEILKTLGFEHDEGNEFLVIATIGAAGLDLPKRFKNIKFKIGSNKNIYLIEHDPFILERMDYIGIIPQNVKGIGISKIHHSINTINEAIDEACIAASQFFMIGNNIIYEYSNSGLEGFDSVMKEFRNALFARDVASINKFLDLIGIYFMEGSFNIKHALKVYNVFLYMIGGVNTGKYENSLETYEQLTSLFFNVQEMLSYLKKLLMENENLEHFTVAANVGNDTYKRILQYININYCNDISVQSIANKFLVNPNYISQLFKKENGETFTEYLTGLRVKCACNMLRAAHVPVYEIAERVGYNDYFHFAKVFKRITGKTPTAYRDGCK